MEKKTTLSKLLEENYLTLNSETFKRAELLSFEKLIHSGDECAKFIRLVLNDDEFVLTDLSDQHYEFAKDRATHAVLTFLIGLAFFRFEGLEELIGERFFPNSFTAKKDVLRLWMLTALYHDWGYYSHNLSNPNYEYKERYDVLSDSYLERKIACLNEYGIRYSCAFAHTYQQILLYDKYARTYHVTESISRKSNRPKEIVDHGILGGVTIFNRLVRNELKLPEPREKELLLAKACCITIAQHNIYKSDSAERDKEYREYCGNDGLEYLYHNNGFNITKETPLLLLLCLVDTFECIKKLGKGENGSKYLQTNTVLDNILIYVSGKTISIDYTPLHEHIRQAKNEVIEKAFSTYLGSGIEGYGNWTCLFANKIQEKENVSYQYEIRLNSD